MSRCWKQGFTRVGEFHYLHHDLDGTPYANPAEMATRIARGRRDHRHRPHAAADSFMRMARFGGAAPHAGQRRFICSVDQFAKLMAAYADGHPRLARRQHRHRPAQPARRDAGRTGGDRAARRRRPGPYPRRRANQRSRGLHRLVGPAAGRVAARTCARRSALVPDPCDAHDCERNRSACQSGAVAGPLPDHRSKPRRRHFSGRANFSTPAAGSASARIPMCWSASPTNCASSNMGSG